MSEVNKSIKEKLDKYPPPVSDICKEVVAFAQNMPEAATKEHLDLLIRKAVKKTEAGE